MRRAIEARVRSSSREPNMELRGHRDAPCIARRASRGAAPPLRRQPTKQRRRRPLVPVVLVLVLVRVRAGRLEPAATPQLEPAARRGGAAAAGQRHQHVAAVGGRILLLLLAPERADRVELRLARAPPRGEVLLQPRLEREREVARRRRLGREVLNRAARARVVRGGDRGRRRLGRAGAGVKGRGVDTRRNASRRRAKSARNEAAKRSRRIRSGGGVNSDTSRVRAVAKLTRGHDDRFEQRRQRV